MKKVCSVVLLSLVLFGLLACKGKSNNSSKNGAPLPDIKILVEKIRDFDDNRRRDRSERDMLFISELTLKKGKYPENKSLEVQGLPGYAGTATCYMDGSDMSDKMKIYAVFDAGENTASYWLEDYPDNILKIRIGDSPVKNITSSSGSPSPSSSSPNTQKIENVKVSGNTYTTYGPRNTMISSVTSGNTALVAYCDDFFVIRATTTNDVYMYGPSCNQIKKTSVVKGGTIKIVNGILYVQYGNANSFNKYDKTGKQIY